MQKITLNLTIEDANLVLEGLGSLPYAKVFNAVGTIQQQAQAQIKSAESAQPEMGSAPEQTVADLTPSTDLASAKKAKSQAS
ncbi:MAG: hypothetical protein ACI9A2_003224 [Halioglobus sp.]|jgi:hypothetical protein